MKKFLMVSVLSVTLLLTFHSCQKENLTSNSLSTSVSDDALTVGSIPTLTAPSIRLMPITQLVFVMNNDATTKQLKQALAWLHWQMPYLNTKLKQEEAAKKMSPYFEAFNKRFINAAKRADKRIVLARVFASTTPVPPSPSTGGGGGPCDRSYSLDIESCESEFFWTMVGCALLVETVGPFGACIVIGVTRSHVCRTTAKTRWEICAEPIWRTDEYKKRQQDSMIKVVRFNTTPTYVVDGRVIDPRTVTLPVINLTTIKPLI